MLTNNARMEYEKYIYERNTLYAFTLYTHISNILDFFYQRDYTMHCFPLLVI